MVYWDCNHKPDDVQQIISHVAILGVSLQLVLVSYQESLQDPEGGGHMPDDDTFGHFDWSHIATAGSKIRTCAKRWKVRGKNNFKL